MAFKEPKPVTVIQPPFLLYIIDDDEDDIFFINHAFREIGLHDVCRGFLSGKEFLDYIHFTADVAKPELVILDYDMPHMNGLDLLKKLRTFSWMDEVPVVFYSDKITNSIESELMENGAFSCIRKGVHPSEQISFAQAITSFLKK
jgi:CheY-like chemotaxis protein